MKKAVLFAALITLFACTPKTVEITEKVESTEFPSDEIAQGNKLYQENCGRCHKHKVVTNYTEEEWKKIVPKMAAKSKLDQTDENKVLQYVLWKIETK